MQEACMVVHGDESARTSGPPTRDQDDEHDGERRTQREEARDERQARGIVGVSGPVERKLCVGGQCHVWWCCRRQ